MRPKSEPNAIRELHRIRQQMQAEEQRVGSDKFWAETNRQGRAFARRHGLRYVESVSTATVVRERPTKYKAR